MLEVKGLDEVQSLLVRVATPAQYLPLLQQIGKSIQDAIQHKTASGIDYLNRGFTPYSEIYKKWKIKKGHSGNVNLWLTGQMLGSLTQTIEDGQVLVHLEGKTAQDKAEYNQDGKVPRPFMGIGPDTEKQIDKMVNDFVDKLLRE